MLDFTKGKWVSERGYVHLAENYLKGIAVVYRLGDDEEEKANGRLIAAAPEMYRLMKSVVDFDHTAFKFDTDGNLVLTREIYDEFRDLLARIDGKESDKT